MNKELLNKLNDLSENAFLDLAKNAGFISENSQVMSVSQASAVCKKVVRIVFDAYELTLKEKIK